MLARVTLIVAQGQTQGKEFVFDERTATLIGKEAIATSVSPRTGRTKPSRVTTAFST